MAFDERIAAWQSTHLSRGTLARIQIIKRGAVAAQDKVLVTFPNGETRRMEPGPSSVISKAVIEEFAPRFLGDPGIIWLSESGNKVVARDDALARSIGLTIDPDRALPDIILVDLGPVEPLLVFVEVVASDGPMSEGRKQTFLTLAVEAGFDPRQIAFLTAYADRSADAFRKTVSMLAWRSFAWFAAEPDHILILHQGGSLTAGRLAALVE